MEVIVDIEGRSAFYVPMQIHDTVKDLKEKVESLVHVAVHKQVFWFNGRVLHDDERGVIPNGSRVRVAVVSDYDDLELDTDLPLLVHDVGDLKRKRRNESPPLLPVPVPVQNEPDPKTKGEAPPQVDVAQPSSSTAVEAKKQRLRSFDELLVIFEKSSTDSEWVFEGLLFVAKKPVLVAFYNKECEDMVPKVDEVGTLLKDEIHVVKIDTEKYPTIASENKIEGPSPAFIIFKDGKRYDRFEGAVSAEELTKWVVKRIENIGSNLG